MEEESSEVVAAPAPAILPPGVSPVADPRALGLAAFATTTFVFGLSFTTIWSRSVGSIVALALVYGGAIQILAGIWAFAQRLNFAATAFCSFGAFYVSYYVLLRDVDPSLRGSNVHTTSAVFFLAWLILSSYIFLASLGVSRGTVVIYFFWFVSLLLLVIGFWLKVKTITIGGGAAAIASAGAAWYASAAYLVNDTFGKVLLPFVDAGSSHR